MGGVSASILECSWRLSRRGLQSSHPSRAELPRLWQTLGHRVQAVIAMALVWSRRTRLATKALTAITALASRDAEDVGATLEGVGDDPTRWEEEVAPGADEFGGALGRVVFRVHVEESEGADATAGSVVAD